MNNPYLEIPDTSFWKKAVAQKQSEEMIPISNPLGLIERDMNISAAGSCFAQKVASFIKSNDVVNFIELESVSEGQPLYSAKYGNVYTTRQLYELIKEAESDCVDETCAVRRDDGRYVDVFRPFVEDDGYETEEAVIHERSHHLGKVRQMFRESDVFVFTLGLTEAWISEETGRTFPVCPAIYTDDVTSTFVNYNYEEVCSDLKLCVETITAINPDIKIIVTVSPVPLTATYTDQHVMSATSFSKSVLRTVCGAVSDSYANVNYFPSYEIVVNPFRDGLAFEENMRSVKKEVVDQVMNAFQFGFFDHDIQTLEQTTNQKIALSDQCDISSNDEPICDDVLVEKSVGF